MNDFEYEIYRKYLDIQEEFKDAKYKIGLDDFLHPNKYDRGAFESIIRVLDDLLAKIHKIMRRG